MPHSYGLSFVGVMVERFPVKRGRIKITDTKAIAINSKIPTGANCKRLALMTKLLSLADLRSASLARCPRAFA
jgi:hypothetical protein